MVVLWHRIDRSLTHNMLQAKGSMSDSLSNNLSPFPEASAVHVMIDWPASHSQHLSSEPWSDGVRLAPDAAAMLQARDALGHGIQYHDRQPLQPPHATP